MKRLRPVHPGHVPVRDLMRPLELTARRLAEYTGLSTSTVDQIARRRQPVTTEIGLRFFRYFGTTPQL